ncbi:membrane protein insertase YidC [Fundicoccus culcitae]|uniref:Membrane protein insertase YidC n=1 Tax=Fundicoccus culcitae TaxID=2969821 RepID=A0ABY5P7P9_9LACT|nr:membrane protein insertase YidC [Fundicoccus culcitae]UUX34574.1 membrane protein insertase YidC [Fundicoccus culcitae]
MKNKQRRIQMIGLLIFVVLIASGCVSYDEAGNPTGWVYQYLGVPASNFLDFLAGIFGGSYGVAIIIVTLITRILMLPSSLKMTKDSMISQARMKIAQPEIDEIREEIEATEDPQEKAALNNELMAVYKKYDISMFGGLSGCLPLIIQMPIISAVYAAIRSSEEILNSTFLGISLGEQSIVVTVLVVIFTFLQGWMMQKSQPQQPQGQNDTAAQTNKTMMLMNPLMIGWITYISAAGLGLYFLTGAIFGIVQQAYSNYIVRPKIQKMIDEEAEKHKNAPKRKRNKKVKKATTTDSQRLVPTKNEVRSVDSNNRNAGKQRNSGKQKRV